MGYHAWFTLAIGLGLPLLLLMALKERFPSFPGPRFHQGWVWSAFVALLSFAVLRNFESFRFLAP